MNQKVSLTKDAPRVSLDKSAALSGRMRVNLNWNQFPDGRPSGWKSFFGGAAGIDLDLACLVEMADGEKGVIQALGDSFGSFSTYPYVQLDQDDRTGQSTDGENLFVNLDHFSEIKRLLVFTFIYEGAASWDKARGVVTVFPPTGSAIEVALDDYAQGLPMCAIAMITNEGGNLVVNREVRYFDGHQSLDRAYGWGMSWVPGRK